MVEIYETRDKVTRRVYPLLGEEQPTRLPFTHTVVVNIRREPLLVLSPKEKSIALVWDTVALEYIAYIPTETDEKTIIQAVINMFGEWKCDINVHVIWEDQEVS